MASGLSVYSANLVLDRLMRDTALTPPASYWVALFTNGSAGSFLRSNTVASAGEVSGNAYARVQVKGATGIDWIAAAAGSTNQDLEIAFPQATGSWGSIIALALMDASTAGNVWWYYDLPAPRAVASPDIFRIPVNQFVINM